MSNQATSKHNQKQQYEVLHSEIADILLGPDSPVRGSDEFDELIAEHDRLQSRHAELQALDAKLVEVLPGLEQAEAKLAAAKKHLNEEKKKLGGFAGELGKAAFAGLRDGELPDNQLFAERKDLQSRIENLQRQKGELLAGENAGIMERAKVQAQHLKLAGQIKIEELKIGSVDRSLGKALLTSKEKVSVQCSHAEEVLAAIDDQRKLIAAARDNVKQCKESVTDRKAAAGEVLDRAAVQNAVSLKSELMEVRKEHLQNEKALKSQRESSVAKALATELLRKDNLVGERLDQHDSLKANMEAGKPLWRKRLDELASRFEMHPLMIVCLVISLVGTVSQLPRWYRLREMQGESQEVIETASKQGKALANWTVEVNKHVNNLFESIPLTGTPEDLEDFSAAISTEVSRLRLVNTNCPNRSIQKSVTEFCDAWESFQDILVIKAPRQTGAAGLRLSLGITADLLSGDYGSALDNVVDRLNEDSSIDSELRLAFLRIYRKLSVMHTEIMSTFESYVSEVDKLVDEFELKFPEGVRQ